MERGPVQRERRIGAIDRLLAHVQAHTTDSAPHALEVDAARYVDPERHERERETLFRREPHLVGLSADLPHPTSWRTLDLAGLPVLLTRDASGRLGAFLNVCRHRGMEVASGEGRQLRIACPYHGWTYGLDGQLTGVPERDAFAGCELEGRDLVRLPVDERHGLVVVHPDPAGSADVGELLGSLEPEIATWGLERLHHVRTTVADMAHNWKMASDAASEGYHVRFLHAPSIGGATVAPSLYESFGRHHWLTFLGRQALDWDGLPTDDDALFDALTFTTYVFPSSFIVYSSGAVAYQRADPGPDPGTCRLTLGVYSWASRDDTSGWIAAEGTADLLWRILADEDCWAQSRIQAGLGSGRVGTVMFGANEPALQSLHANWDAALATPR
jgi:nitrite reductase/ring-hydroxylating ferredoxin subunit